MAKRYYLVRIRENAHQYVENGIVAVGWSQVDFSQCLEKGLSPAQKVEEMCYHTGASPQLVGRKKAEVTRFCKIKSGDLVVVPCKGGFYIGESTGHYLYSSEAVVRDLANQLQVRFRCGSDGKPLRFVRAGKNMALTTKLRTRGFSILEFDDERVVQGIEELWESGLDRAESDRVVERQEEEDQAFIQRMASVLQNYSATSLPAGGQGMEEMVANLLRVNGFIVKILSKRCGEGKADADILAVKPMGTSSELSFAYFIQVKHYVGETGLGGLEQIRKFRDQIQNGYLFSYEKEGSALQVMLLPDNIRYGVLTSGTFADRTVEEAEKDGLFLIDGIQLAEMLCEKIDDLPEYQHLLGFYKTYAHI
ncbi:MULTISPECIES: restriction endonuclease [Eubacteriales]|uniref:Restriction endonuclease n=1 Tax=Bittarella massiliensis (ex Durand et al. 2017) TaxID=1720313 RepID=A0AAQ1MDT6_9FIRM|nr:MULTISPECIES: restriction endonuclease [Eubacteriales]ERJ00784.1 hypothetical protein HMPREF0262_00456 [Clostridium sp. ATCC 29733]MZL70335.1 hypothetical protein [Bittarella massiliensis (ex Durand et al. 2017)]MZL80899.1 hypothetical protein [Bittarella massiliensis (ex Durand et al. 2017)]SHG18939.1 Restriction endonuclease [Bittarella massiliensis (ex Durand et al. 2017)]